MKLKCQSNCDTYLRMGRKHCGKKKMWVIIAIKNIEVKGENAGF